MRICSEIFLGSHAHGLRNMPGGGILGTRPQWNFDSLRHCVMPKGLKVIQRKFGVYLIHEMDIVDEKNFEC